MRRSAAFVLALALGTSLAHADIDERYVREGAEDWGKRITAQLGLPGFGRSVAVVIGVGDYRNGWKPLEAPPRDAERVRDFLRDEAGFDIIYTLTDAAATRARIRRLMVEELPALIGPQDRLVFYFSGHGTQRELFNDKVVGYLVLRDSALDGFASMIDMRDVERWWEGLARAKQSLFILDACFSGLGLQGKGDDLRDRTIKELSRRGHHIITAGSADQESYASMSRWGGSLFTTALIDGMKGRADTANADAPEDGIVSLKELWDYVEKRVRAETPPETMTPQLAAFEFSNAGEFFFVADPDAARTATSATGTAEGKGRAVSAAAPALDPREMQLWNDVKESGSAAMLEHFIAAYPDSVFVPLAHARIDALARDNQRPSQDVALAPPETLFKDQPDDLAKARFQTAEHAIGDGDTATALRNYKLTLAADEDHIGALRALGSMYFDGAGLTAVNVPEAHRLWKRCSELGDTECRFNLAMLYLDEESGRLHDPDLGERLLRETALSGFGDADEALRELEDERAAPAAPNEALDGAIAARRKVDALYAELMRSLEADPTGVSGAALSQEIGTLADGGDARAQVYVAVVALAAVDSLPNAATMQYALLAVQRASVNDDPLSPLLTHLVSSQLTGAAYLDPGAGLDAARAPAETAAEAGDPFAAAILSALYSDGSLGFPRDTSLARKYATLAEAGDFKPAWFR